VDLLAVHRSSEDDRLLDVLRGGTGGEPLGCADETTNSAS
jgi:hypothetical protein